MEYEIEGTLKLPKLVFDDEALTVIQHAKETKYLYENMDQIKIAYKQLFADFGALEFLYNGKPITISYNKRYTKKLETVIPKIKQHKTKTSSTEIHTTSVSMPQDPVAYLTKCKEMLDLGLITQEEYESKKKQLLNL